MTVEHRLMCSDRASVNSGDFGVIRPMEAAWLS